MSLPGIPDAIEGSLDGVLAGRVCGWARDPEMPEAMLEIEIEIDSEIVGHGRCDHFREDLVAAGVGSGRHGFAVPIGTDWNDGLAHEIRVRAAGTRRCPAGRCPARSARRSPARAPRRTCSARAGQGRTGARTQGSGRARSAAAPARAS
jgi:hypothetical protein